MEEEIPTPEIIKECIERDVPLSKLEEDKKVNHKNIYKPH